MVFLMISKNFMNKLEMVTMYVGLYSTMHDNKKILPGKLLIDERLFAVYNGHFLVFLLTEAD